MKVVYVTQQENENTLIETDANWLKRSECRQLTTIFRHFAVEISRSSVTQQHKLRVPMNLNSHEYDLLCYCRLSFSRYFTDNCANILDTMMSTLFFFKPIFPVGKLIEDIIGDLLGKH